MPEEKVLPTIVPVPHEDDIALQMNDDGNLEFDPEQMAAVEKFLADSNKGEGETAATETPAATEEGQKEAPVISEQELLFERMLMDRERDKERIDYLTTQLQQTAAMLSQKANETPVDPNAPGFSDIINDNIKGPELIDKLVELKLQKKLEGLNLPGLYETIGKMASKAEYDSFKSTHPDIIDPATKDVRQSIKDVMIPVLNGDKSLTYEAAYQKLFKARAIEPPSKPDNALATPKKESTPPRDLAARAAALKVESGVSARQIGSKPADTFKEAFMQAWDDSLKGK